jgi:hypothetical protein
MKLRTICLLALLLAPRVAMAQSDARVSGMVRDPQGASVPNAQVSVKNDKTGEERKIASNTQGYFVVAGLKPSTYTIRVTLPSFAPLEYPQMPLAASQELTLDFDLKPAGVSETVDVTADAPVLDLSSARLGVNVSELEVGQLPVNGRQMSQLLLQAPGAQNAGTGTWQDIRFSGQANEQNVIKYDGVEASAVIDASPGNVNGENNTPFKLQASLENVQEFRVESSNYPAEYGTGTGGQVSVVTKSGGNVLHGTVFEYLRNDRFDAANYFDSQHASDGSVLVKAGSVSTRPKSLLRQNQFGGSIGGRVVENKAFFFGSYEGYRLTAGSNIIEAVPSDAAWARAVPAVAVLRPGFLAKDAIILAGASTNPDFDVAQLVGLQRVTEDAVSGRLDFKMTDNWSAFVRVSSDSGKNHQPQGVTGRFFDTTSKPRNAVFNLQRVMGSAINEFKIGYNSAASTENGSAPIPLLNGIIINLSGSVANSGIAGQSSSTGLAIPGGLVRVNSAGNGAAAPYNPYSLAFSDSLSRVMGGHYTKIGADVRMIRMTNDQIGGITYSFSNISSFLSNTPSTIQYFGNLSEPSPFHNGATGPKHTAEELYAAYAQDEWHLARNVTMNYGLRLDYYTPLREVDHRIVKFNITTGALDPDTTRFYKTRAEVQPRLSLTFSPGSGSTVLKGGFGMFVGPGQTEDQIQPVESERISTTTSGGAYPVDPAVIRANFTDKPTNRSYQPRAYSNDYTLPERHYQYTAALQQRLAGGMSASVAFVGDQGRNLFLRSIANRTIGVISNGASAATQIREFDIMNADGTVSKPFAEIDYKTSGGHNSYNGLQLGLQGRARAVTMNAQYTLGYSKGNSGGSNEAITAGNNARDLADFEYDNGYNNFDVRHNFNLSLLYQVPGEGALTGGWTIGGIANARSGLPMNILITRPDIAYVDGSGVVWNSPAADRTAVVNTPGGGSTRSTRRPDLIPGVDPFIKDGGLVFLNPAAFATPAPGTFGNLERNVLHGPRFRQIDMVISKRITAARGPSAELRVEVFNLFNFTNFTNPNITLPNALPSTVSGVNESPTQANRVQPGQPFSASSAGTFGTLSSTVGTTVGLGTSRQVQFALRLNF